MTKCCTMIIKTRHQKPQLGTFSASQGPSPAERRVAGTLIKSMIDVSGGIVQVPTASHGHVCSKHNTISHNYC